jgi:hypothetical protein
MEKQQITLQPGQTIEITVASNDKFYSISEVMEIRGGTRKTVTNRLKKNGLITILRNRPKVSQEQLNQYLTIYK